MTYQPPCQLPIHTAAIAAIFSQAPIAGQEHIACLLPEFCQPAFSAATGGGFGGPDAGDKAAGLFDFIIGNFIYRAKADRGFSHIIKGDQPQIARRIIKHNLGPAAGNRWQPAGRQALPVPQKLFP